MVDEDLVEKYEQVMNDMMAEIQKVVYGQEDVIESLVKALAAGGHVLLEGVPGTGKTASVLAMSEIIAGSNNQRIQFTPDLLPSDIVGSTIYREGRGFEVKKGPIFANIIAADEINRTPPKVQSAMLQAMAEKEVTIGKDTFNLPDPFMVVATQNPLEQKGVYPLPEAQMDRFLFKIDVGYAERDAEKRIIDENLDVQGMEAYDMRKILTVDEVRELQNLLPELQSRREVKKYIVNLVDASRYPGKYGIDLGQYIQWGGSPRATIYLNVAAKANALLAGRSYTTPEDVRDVAYPIFRHRIVFNYEGKAEGLNKEDVIDELVRKVPVTV